MPMPPRAPASIDGMESYDHIVIGAGLVVVA